MKLPCYMKQGDDRVTIIVNIKHPVFWCAVAWLLLKKAYAAIRRTLAGL